MKVESFTKKIYKSTLISSLITNVVTMIIIYLVAQSLIDNVYKNRINNSNEYVSSYINSILDLKDFYDSIKLFESNKTDISYQDLFDNVTSRNSVYHDINIFFEKIDTDPQKYLPSKLLIIYKQVNGNNNVRHKLIEVKNDLYIVDIKYFERNVHMQFFNIKGFTPLEARLKNENYRGYTINNKYYPVGSNSYSSKNITIPSKTIIPMTFTISNENYIHDKIILFLTILLLSILRFTISLLTSRLNINNVIKPLNILVKNTEKLASHEMCEKLNRFDYPYLEFKQLAEAFNKVLLSRELSEIKLFRSFEQMENVVHKRTQELISTNEQLTTAITRANEANALKSQFLANISHEIRTPLNCIIGFCDIILIENHNEIVTQQVKQILHESETLLSLINDFLDYSKIDAGKMTLNHSELDIRFLISSLIKSGQVQLGDKKIKLIKDISDSVPKIILSDELRLYQIISNIFYNAIKFTTFGSITIKVDNFQIGPNKQYLVISITDTGIGIPKNRIESIFNKFEQVDGSLTRKYRGSGLGLTICKKTVELMEGSIDVQSQINEGSTFTCTIPFNLETEIPIEDTKEPISDTHVENIKGNNILLVEDYPVNQIVAKKHLEMNNHIVTVAENGQEAIELCSSKIFDLILMDLQMPILDGFKATKRIRKANGPNKNTPILAMTANAMETARQTCLDTGMNGIITKPIRKKIFLKEVDRWLKIKEKEETSPLSLIVSKEI